jgi:hypothetical protein
MLDFFAELPHVVKRSARRLLGRYWSSHAVGIDTHGWLCRLLLLEGHGGFFLKLLQPVSIDISAERSRVEAPFPSRAAPVVERNTSGFGLGGFVSGLVGIAAFRVGSFGHENSLFEVQMINQGFRLSHAPVGN